MKTDAPDLATFLLQARRAGTLVHLERHRLEPAPARSVGFVVGVGDALVMLHRLSDRIDLDGYEILRLRDVTAFRDDFPQASFYRRALELKGETAMEPEAIDLSSVAAALRGVGEAQPLITLHRERAAPDEVAIGRVRQTLPSGVRLHWITPSAEWADDDTLYRYDSITRIEFGGEYERTLAMVAPPLPESS
jgi:hypothetical protein